MAWVAVDKDGAESIFTLKPSRTDHDSFAPDFCDEISLPKGSIKKLIGRDLDWNDEPVELRNE